MRKVRTLVAECSSSDVNLDSFTIETGEESTNDNPDDCIEIPKDSCVFTLTPTNLEHIDDLPLAHLQLIDLDQQGAPQLDSFQNDEAFIDYFSIRNYLPIGDLLITWHILERVPNLLVANT